MKNIFDENKRCCACSACYNICPQNAITLKEDGRGFVYPKIDENKCINCGLCKKVCAFQNNKQYNQMKKQVYMACSTDKNILLKSASGGVFASVAREILKNGGCVYGASLEREEKNLIPKHIRVDSECDLYKLQGSKYVQCDVSEVFKLIKKDLEDNRVVLFSGTPCQVAGLRSFLKYDYEKLFTIDIICHGVPSAKFFQDYIINLENKFDIKIINFNFRDKRCGWGLTASYEYEKNGIKKSKMISTEDSLYYKLFLESKIYRDSCYVCPYANSNRPADITIGDYWGIENVHPELLKKCTVKHGVSCLLINNSKGTVILEKYCKELNVYESSYENVVKGNEQLSNPSNKPKEREIILSMYENNGYASIEKLYKKNIKYYVKRVYNLFPNKLKKSISRLRKKKYGESNK